MLQEALAAADKQVSELTARLEGSAQALEQLKVCLVLPCCILVLHPCPHSYLQPAMDGQENVS